MEAAIVLPVVLLFSVLLIMSSVYFFQSQWTSSIASSAADRIAHSWSNSYKHPVTGMYSPLQQDPLYWRLLYDGAESWFVPNENGISASVQFPGGEEEGNFLSIHKLKAGISGLPSGTQGGAFYVNSGWRQSVAVHAAHPFRAPSFFGIRWGSGAGSPSAETVVDPAEYIRNIDLARSYLPIVKQIWEKGTIQRILAPWLNTDGGIWGEGESLQFQVHADAVHYLRSLTRGAEARYSTELTGYWRLIDALDGQDIAHQAYLGAKSLNLDMREQLMKDVELMRNGKIKGVVWHFFRRTGSDACGPNPALRQELQRHGIAIVIHS